MQQWLIDHGWIVIPVAGGVAVVAWAVVSAWWGVDEVEADEHDPYPNISMEPRSGDGNQLNGYHYGE
jgi:hypothetical protein